MTLKWTSFFDEGKSKKRKNIYSRFSTLTSEPGCTPHVSQLSACLHLSGSSVQSTMFARADDTNADTAKACRNLIIDPDCGTRVTLKLDQALTSYEYQSL